MSLTPPVMQLEVWSPAVACVVPVPSVCAARQATGAIPSPALSRKRVTGAGPAAGCLHGKSRAYSALARAMSTWAQKRWYVNEGAGPPFR